MKDVALKERLQECRYYLAHTRDLLRGARGRVQHLEILLSGLSEVIKDRDREIETLKSVIKKGGLDVSST